MRKLSRGMIFAAEIALLVVGGVLLSLSGHIGGYLAWIAPLGEAAVVAGILAMTVDPYLKSKLTAEMFGTTLRAIFGKGLPTEVQTEIRRLGSCTIVRKTFEADYRFTNFDPELNVVTVNTIIRFQASNIGTDREEFMHTLWVGDPETGKVVQMKSTDCEIDYNVRTPQLVNLNPGWGYQKGGWIPPGRSAGFKGETVRALPSTWDDVFTFEIRQSVRP